MAATLSFCSLCACKHEPAHFHSDLKRNYFRCSECYLIQIPPAQRLSQEAEKSEYDKHQNSPEDPGYRKFLSRLFNPLNERLKAGGHGLDFGCGSGPTLSIMFEEVGHKMSLFDPFYAPEKQIFQMRYDFITASEVVEHLHSPAKELQRLWSILNPGGWLGIMTKLALEQAAFSRWHYKNDPTHVCFFSDNTMRWLARKWQTNYVKIGADVALFQKPLSLKNEAL